MTERDKRMEVQGGWRATLVVLLALGGMAAVTAPESRGYQDNAQGPTAEEIDESIEAYLSRIEDYGPSDSYRPYDYFGVFEDPLMMAIDRLDKLKSEAHDTRPQHMGGGEPAENIPPSSY